MTAGDMVAAIYDDIGSVKTADIVSVQGTEVVDIGEFKATIDIQPILTAVSELNNLSVLDIEGIGLAKEITLSSIVTSIAAIPTTDSVTDITPILAAISSLNDVTPADVRAAFDPLEFTDKNTEIEIHDWLNSYTNKDTWKVDVDAVRDSVWNKVV